MRLAFAGTPEFAAVALGHLLQQGFDIGLVLTQPDRPAGRGQQVQASPVKRLALARGLALAQPHGLRLDGRFAADAQAAREALRAAGVDAMVVVAYGLILPTWVLEMPRLGCVNIHASLLPRWRGAAPIQRAIEAGDVTTGITIIRMDAGLDTGPMLAHEAVPVEPDDSAQTLHDRLAPIGARLVASVLASLREGVARPLAQPDEGSTYATKISKDEASIDWSRPALEIERRVRAFDPAPGCTFVHAGQTLKLWRARVVSARPGLAPAEVRWAPHGVVVGCGQDALELLEIQRPGGRRVGGQALVQGMQATAHVDRSNR